TMRLGLGKFTSNTYIAGINGASVSSGAPIFIDSSGKLGTSGGSIPASLITGTVAPAAGSSSYIQNGSGLQTGASLNIDGNGLFGGTVSAFGLGSFGSVSATTVSATSYTNNFASMLLSSPAPGQLQIGDFSTVNTVIDGFSTTLNG